MQLNDPLIQHEIKRLASIRNNTRWVAGLALIGALSGAMSVHVYSFFMDSPLVVGSMPPLLALISYLTAHVFYFVQLGRASLMASHSVVEDITGGQWDVLRLTGKLPTQIVQAKGLAVFAQTARSAAVGLLPVVWFYLGYIQSYPSASDHHLFRISDSLADLYIPETFNQYRFIFNTEPAGLGLAIGLAVLYGLAGLALVISLSLMLAVWRRRASPIGIDGVAARLGLGVVAALVLVAMSAAVRGLPPFESLLAYRYTPIDVTHLENTDRSMIQCYSAVDAPCQSVDQFLRQIAVVETAEMVQIGLMSVADNGGLLIGTAMDTMRGVSHFSVGSAAIGLLMYLALTWGAARAATASIRLV